MGDTMVADDWVIYGARASAAMILTYLSWNISGSAPEVLRMDRTLWFFYDTINFLKKLDRLSHG